MAKNLFSSFVVMVMLAGCGVNPGKNADPVEVSGKVSINGKPVADAQLHFQPTGAGLQAMFAVKNGQFRGTMTPGKYTYYLDAAKPSVLASIPEKFRYGSLERQMEIDAGDSLEIRFEN